jgi:hypothetical protein
VSCAGSVGMGGMEHRSNVGVSRSTVTGTTVTGIASGGGRES